MEEDHFAAEDFLSVLSLMKNERDLRYPNCDILCLGTYLKQTNYKEDHKKVRINSYATHFGIKLEKHLSESTVLHFAD